VRPTTDDPLVKVVVDSEFGAEGFTYVLRSGREGAWCISRDALE
jgi:hypothetical protein